MPKKKTEEVEETTEVVETEATEETAVEMQSAEAEVVAESSEVAETVEEKVEAVEAKAETEETPKKASGKKKSVEEPEAVEKVVEAVRKTSKRAEKIGVVQSDKMTNTVTVRVDRVVKHPVYRKYVKRRKNFMAHDDKGAAIGDKVRIIETRPLSARKRWRVVEIIQKAEK